MLLFICRGPRKGTNYCTTRKPRYQVNYCTEETIRFTAKFTLCRKADQDTNNMYILLVPWHGFFSVVHLLVSWYLFLVVHFVGTLVSWLYTLLVSWYFFVVHTLFVPWYLFHGILVPFPGCTHFLGILVPFPWCELGCKSKHCLFVSAPECRDIETVLYNRTSVRTYVFSVLCSIFQYVIKRWLRTLQLSRSENTKVISRSNISYYVTSQMTSITQVH